MSESEAGYGEEVLGKAYDARLLRRLIGYLRPYRRSAIGAVLLILVSSLLQLVGPLATGVAIDWFIRPQAAAGPSGAGPSLARTIPWIGAVDPIQGILWVAAAYLAATLGAFASLYAQAYVLQMMGQRIMADLRRQIFGHLQRLPVAFFDRNPVGRLVTRVTTDVDALNELFTAGLVSIVGDVLLLAGIVGVLFWLDWRLALVTFAILPLLLLLTAWFKARARDSYREVRVLIARINSFLQEHITGMSVVQLFGREERQASRFASINGEHRDANVRAILYYAVFYPGVEMVTVLGVALILWYGGGEVVRQTLSIGALVAFLQYAQRFYQPLADLSEKYNILQSAMASSERIFRLLDEATPIVSPPTAYRPTAVAGRIEFDRVAFSYQAGRPVLHDLSFTVEPGQTLAIVGPTGAGKSTLANLLLRFYDVSSGAVRIDGRDVRDWDLERLRRSIALVLQDVFLFSGTVETNIRLGASEIDIEAVRRAAGDVGAAEFIERLPEGFSAPVRERGAGLSVGEKQLVAFARALAFDPRILVLDEATSSVDTETELRIQRALERLLAGRTSIVIAHRLSTVQRADRILVLVRGALREQGTHRQLMEQDGFYARLVRLQFEAAATGAGGEGGSAGDPENRRVG